MLTLATSSACVMSAERSMPTERMPISVQAFFFMRTYVAESRRSPTSTTARPGVTPSVSRISSTWVLSSARIVAAMAFPAVELGGKGGELDSGGVEWLKKTNVEVHKKLLVLTYRQCPCRMTSCES